MEQYAKAGKSTIRYAKITLKVNNLLSLEAPTACPTSIGERLARFKSCKKASSQAFNCQTDTQKVQGRGYFLRIQGREGQEIGKK